MDAHYDRVSQNSYELCIMHLHYALGVHIVCYVLRITYYVLCITHCHWESTSSVMYYVLRIMRIMHYALGVHIVCYVLRIMFYMYMIYYILYIISEVWGSEYCEYPPNREIDFDFAFVSFVRASGRGEAA